MLIKATYNQHMGSKKKIFLRTKKKIPTHPWMNFSFLHLTFDEIFGIYLPKKNVSSRPGGNLVVL